MRRGQPLLVLQLNPANQSVPDRPGNDWHEHPPGQLPPGHRESDEDARQCQAEEGAIVPLERLARELRNPASEITHESCLCAP